LHLGLHAGVGDDEFAVIEDVVAYQAVEEFGQFLAKKATNLLGQSVDFGERVRQAMSDLDILSAKFPH